MVAPVAVVDIGRIGVEKFGAGGKAVSYGIVVEGEEVPERRARDRAIRLLEAAEGDAQFGARRVEIVARVAGEAVLREFSVATGI